MPVVVQKYGGTSVESVERIENVAERVVQVRKSGNDVVVVISAMGDTTDKLIELAHGISENPYTHRREMDILLTAGEQVSMSLLAMAVGKDAISFTGEQAGILTDANHGNAKIRDLQVSPVRKELDRGKVVIVAGFQGIIPESGDVTTLGRGGSDTTAVALAHALGAKVCEIYTDVDGVYTADPRVVPDARRLKEISFDEMLELTAGGTSVLAERAAEFARRYGVLVHIKSSFHDGEGTWIRKVTMEQAIVTGVTFDLERAEVTISGVPDDPGMAEQIFTAVGEVSTVDLISQGKPEGGLAVITFTVPEEKAEDVIKVSKRVADKIGATARLDRDVVEVKIVGDGMGPERGIAARMFGAISRKGINIGAISSSTISVTVVVPQDRAKAAVRACHDEFDLSSD